TESQNDNPQYRSYNRTRYCDEPWPETLGKIRIAAAHGNSKAGLREYYCQPGAREDEGVENRQMKDQHSQRQSKDEADHCYDRCEQDLTLRDHSCADWQRSNVPESSSFLSDRRNSEKQRSQTHTE